MQYNRGAAGELGDLLTPKLTRPDGDAAQGSEQIFLEPEVILFFLPCMRHLKSVAYYL